MNPELYKKVATFEELDYKYPAWQCDLIEQSETLSLFDEFGGILSDEDWARCLNMAAIFAHQATLERLQEEGAND